MASCWVLSKNNLNLLYRIIQIRETGLIQHWDSAYLPNIDKCLTYKHQSFQDEVRGVKALTVIHLSGAFLLVLIGNAMAIVAFLLETIYWKILKRVFWIKTIKFYSAFCENLATAAGVIFFIFCLLIESFYKVFFTNLFCQVILFFEMFCLLIDFFKNVFFTNIFFSFCFITNNFSLKWVYFFQFIVFIILDHTNINIQYINIKYHLFLFFHIIIRFSKIINVWYLYHEVKCNKINHQEIKEMKPMFFKLCRLHFQLYDWYFI